MQRAWILIILILKSNTWNLVAVKQSSISSRACLTILMQFFLFVINKNKVVRTVCYFADVGFIGFLVLC